MEQPYQDVQLTYYIHPKENFYFAVSVFFTIIIYYLIGEAIHFVFILGSDKANHVALKYLISAISFLFALVLRYIFLVGYIKGNAVKVTKEQLPDIYNIVHKQAALLQFSSVPDVYILQSGGLLNAFATSFFSRNYIVVYSDVLAAAYEQNMKVVEFIIGHEMGHLKRHHILKYFLVLPSIMIPFLRAAYSRGCEYTCDSIGHGLCPEGARPGMLLLAAGKGLFTKVNANKFAAQHYNERSFASWFAEKFSSHPNLTKRVEAFSMYSANELPPEPVAAITKREPRNEDTSKYMPQ